MSEALPRIRFNNGALEIECRPATPPEEMVENIRSSLSRPGLRDLRQFKPHSETLAVAAGGPSLQDTYSELAAQGHIAAVNGSLGFLLDKGIVPTFCGVLDSNPRLTDIVVADKRVRYLIASNCHPTLFDKLLNAGCKVWLWHTTPKSLNTEAAADLIKEARPGNWLMVGGGCSIGLRWVSLGYVMGYRKFHLHGLDCSFRDRQTHAYPDRRCGDWVDHSAIEVNGYRTSINFMQQVSDCANMLSRFQELDYEPTEITFHGEGLLQSCWRHWKAHPEMTPQQAFSCF